MAHERETLEQNGIHPSAQRVAVAEFVLHTDAHPSADQIFAAVRARFPMISRATVYNTLNLFVDRGLLRELHLTEGCVVFDPKIERHHHFIDEESGAITDVEWDRVGVCDLDTLGEFQVRDYQVVMRGKSRH